MRENGAGFVPLPPCVIEQSGAGEKIFRNFWKTRNFLARMLPSAVGGVFCDAMRQTRNSQKALAPNLATGQPQYGLQIAEGMVTFFESYERELERYWTKTLFFQLS
jgi:hypothetical protein